MHVVQTITDLLDSYGYWVVALGVGIESSGVPFPGETILVVAGRAGGFPLLLRYGKLTRLDPRRIKLGIWLFRRYGAIVVFFGRFVAVLRTWAAVLAGTNRMPWGQFLVANAAGGVVWAAAVGMLAFRFGEAAAHLAGRFAWAMLGVAIVAVIAAGSFLRKHERRLLEEADLAVPGPLEDLV